MLEDLSVAARYDQGAEADSLLAVRLRERIFRRALVIADMGAAALAAFVAIDSSVRVSLRPGYLLVMPLIVFVAKIQGLYDRDELVIRKSTLDELPRLVNLATLFALLVWLARHFVVIGAPGHGNVAPALGRPDRLPRARSYRGASLRFAGRAS
jgi:hypothetical protein